MCCFLFQSNLLVMRKLQEMRPLERNEGVKVKHDAFLMSFLELRSISTVLQSQIITIPCAAGVTPKHTGVTVSDQKRKHSSRGRALLSYDIYLTLTEAWGMKTKVNDSRTGGHESWTNDFKRSRKQ